jgi:hypothetical protein
MADNQARRYSSSDVSDIIRSGLEHKSASGDISFGELLEIAHQAGLNESQLNAAIEFQESDAQLEKARNQFKKNEKQGFSAHFRVYCIVNGAFLLVAILAESQIHMGLPAAAIPLVPMIGWGIGLAIHGSVALFPSDENIEKGARKLLAKEAERREDEYLDRVMG